jgi:hypothetical protein
MKWFNTVQFIQISNKMTYQQTIFFIRDNYFSNELFITCSKHGVFLYLFQRITFVHCGQRKVSEYRMAGNIPRRCLLMCPLLHTELQRNEATCSLKYNKKNHTLKYKLKILLSSSRYNHIYYTTCVYIFIFA